MHAYRFRMLLDDQEDFLRDYDILSSQTFLDFHNLIVESVELQGDELASFFVCDRNWRKKKEITLMNMQDDSQEEEEDDDVLNPKYFFVELTKIVDADKTKTYPVCIKSTGKLATTLPLPIITDDTDDDDIALISEFDDILNNDDEDSEIMLFEPEL